MTHSINYNIMKHKLEPLDLLMFRGSDFVSNFISGVEDDVLGSGDFTHVGIVVNKEILPNVEQLEPNKFYVWESTMSKEYPGSGRMTPDVITGKGKFGVQIRPLEQVIKSYTAAKGAHVALCKLKHNPWPFISNRKTIIKTIKDIYQTSENKPYPLGCCVLLASIFSCLRPFRNNFQQITVKDQQVFVNYSDNNNLKTFFCSELIGYIYQKVGIISEKMDVRNIVPMDFLGYDLDSNMDIVYDPIYISI